MKAGGARGQGRRAGGFTLIELMVVIAIIIILAGLLIAAMPGAKKRAYDSATGSLLAGLVSDCENYYADFDAYPGPMTAAVTAAGNLSGTQNMLLGLTYPVYTTPYYTGIANGSAPTAASGSPPVPGYAPAGWVLVPGVNVGGPSPAGVVNASDANGPLNYSTSPPRSLKAYYGPTAKESAVIATATGWKTFPTVVDRYPDAMPILYYRKTTGVDGTATATLNPNGSMQTLAEGGTPIVNASTNASASYYYNENSVYTQSAALKSASGQVYNESANIGTVGPDASNNTFRCGMDVDTLATCVSNISLPGPGGQNLNISARGGFVLISAGYDHLFGMNKKNVLNDDIVMVGGH